MRKTPKIHYIVVAVAMFVFFVLHTIPFLSGIFYSFTNSKGYGDWNFVGLRNYINMFQDAAIGNAYIFTFKVAIIATILVNIISIALAVGLNSKIKFQGILKTVFFIPYTLGMVIIGFVFKFFFANILPRMGQLLGIEALSANILGNADTAWIGILVVTVWQALAFNTLLYLSGLTTIDTAIYEAAAVDGASPWMKFKKITFPLLAPFFTINVVLCLRNFLMAFNQIMAMTEGGPGTSTQSVSVMIFQNGFQGGTFAYQSANAVVFFLVIAAIAMFQVVVLGKREEKING